jgi:hypothetical protein
VPKWAAVAVIVVIVVSRIGWFIEHWRGRRRSLAARTRALFAEVKK